MAATKHSLLTIHYHTKQVFQQGSLRKDIRLCVAGLEKSDNSKDFPASEKKGFGE